MASKTQLHMIVVTRNIISNGGVRSRCYFYQRRGRSGKLGESWGGAIVLEKRISKRWRGMASLFDNIYVENMNHIFGNRAVAWCNKRLLAFLEQLLAFLFCGLRREIRREIAEFELGLAK